MPFTESVPSHIDRRAEASVVVVEADERVALLEVQHRRSEADADIVETRTASHVDVGERSHPAVDAREAERTAVTEADRHDRRIRWFFTVLMQAESGVLGIQVDDRRVRVVRDRLRAVRAEGGRNRSARQPDERVGERLHRRTVGVVGGSRVHVRQPMPAEADRLHAHEVTGRYAGMTKSGRGERPTVEVSGEAFLVVGREPVRDVDDAGENVPGRARVRVIVEWQRHLPGRVRRRRCGSEGHGFAAESAPRAAASSGRCRVHAASNARSMRLASTPPR